MDFHNRGRIGNYVASLDSIWAIAPEIWATCFPEASFHGPFHNDRIHIDVHIGIICRIFRRAVFAELERTFK